MYEPIIFLVVIILYITLIVWLIRYGRKNRVGIGYKIEDLQKMAAKQEQMLKEIKDEIAHLRREKN